MSDQESLLLTWRKSTFSAEGNCVEVATANGRVFVRDSKDSAGQMLAFTSSEWEAFIAGAASGEFNLPA